MITENDSLHMLISACTLIARAARWGHVSQETAATLDALRNDLRMRECGALDLVANAHTLAHYELGYDAGLRTSNAPSQGAAYDLGHTDGTKAAASRGIYSVSTDARIDAIRDAGLWT